MIVMEGLHEKGIINQFLPINVIVNKNFDFSYPSHWHNALEIIYAYKNGMKLFVNNNEYILNEKDIIVIPSGYIHSIDSHYSEGEKIYIQFNTSILNNIGNCKEISSFLYQAKVYSIDEELLRKELEDQIDKIEKVFARKDLGCNLYLTARICDIFALLLKNFAVDNHNGNYNNSCVNANGTIRLNKALNFIKENYQSDISLYDVANVVGFSQTYFSKMFKEIIGENFHVFLNKFRIQKFEKLLMEEPVSITEAAFSCGFNSISTFNRTFKNIKGCTPSQFIKMKKNG